MNFLNAFFHGEALAEILMEGHNPYALKKLEAADVDALRDSLRAGEALLGYAVGRIVMSGLPGTRCHQPIRGQARTQPPLGGR
jgi:hypothetical protein